MLRNDCYAYFTVVGFSESPEGVTRKLGLQPTKSWAKGEIDRRTRMEKRFSRWSLYSRLRKTASLERHVGDVLEQLWPRRAAVASLAKRHETVLQLVGYFHLNYPGFGLDRLAMSRIGALGLSLDCDFYYLYSDEREDT